MCLVLGALCALLSGCAELGNLGGGGYPAGGGWGYSGYGNGEDAYMYQRLQDLDWELRRQRAIMQMELQRRNASEAELAAMEAKLRQLQAREEQLLQEQARREAWQRQHQGPRPRPHPSAPPQRLPPGLALPPQESPRPSPPAPMGPPSPAIHAPAPLAPLAKPPAPAKSRQ